MNGVARNGKLLAGLGLILGISVAAAVADALTKRLSADFKPPQLYFFCGLFVAAISLATCRSEGRIGPSGSLRTRFGGMLLLRSALVLVSVSCYFKAFALLPLAEVFIFIGMMPLLAALMAGPLLSEAVPRSAWVALGFGACGILFLFPSGVVRGEAGHVFAAGGVLSGTLSLVLMRKMMKVEPNALAQVFWPHAVMVVVMGMALPFVWVPMGLRDSLLVAAYALAVFLARWLMVPALLYLKAHVATMLMNLQFVWMMVIGKMIFGEMPQAGVIVGGACIAGAGSFLVWQQARASSTGGGAARARQDGKPDRPPPTE